MALPYESGQGTPQSHSPTTASGLESLRPQMKKIKRTSFPDWEDGPASKRASVVPIPKSMMGNFRLSTSHSVQEAQRQWEKEQREQLENQRRREQTTEASAPVDDNSGSEDHASDTSISEEYESDSEAEPRTTGTAQHQELAKSPTVLESDSAMHTQGGPHGTANPGRLPTRSHASHLSASAGSLTFAARTPSSAVNIALPGSLTTAAETLVQSDLPPHTGTPKPVGTAEPSVENEANDSSGYKIYLNPNELEARIRMESGKPHLSGNATESGSPQPRLGRFRDRIGPHGELFADESDRLYSNFIMPDGRQINTGSLLIPTNYQLHTDPENPWICPVRTCRRIAASVSSLGGHFSASHNKTTFNDNLDGTISTVGTYNKGPGLTSPGVIVSRGPVPPGTPAAVPPRMTTTAILKLHATTSKRADLYDMRKHSLPVSRSPVPLPTSREGKPLDEPIEYLHSFLAPKQEKWERLDIQHLKRCSRKRDLPPSWVRHHSKGLICPNIYAFSLAYLVGDEVTDSSEKCTAPRMSTARLSDRCIRLPAGLSKDARSEFSKVSTCVGCRYWCFVQRRRNHCSWSHEPQDSGASDAGAESNEQDRASPSRGSTDGESPARYSDSSAIQPTEPAVPRSRKVRTGTNHQTGSSLRHSRSLTMAPVEELSDNQLEMEDWEFAPGRLMSRQEPAQNVAFSNSYLTSREPVVISDDISFNVAILGSGSTVHFSVEESKLRTCSVAAGKVKVKIGTTEFKIGPHGMFKVMPGESCVVENRQYVDAYIHCTTVDNYELAS